MQLFWAGHLVAEFGIELTSSVRQFSFFFGLTFLAKSERDPRKITIKMRSSVKDYLYLQTETETDKSNVCP